jgi:cytochrome c biogenesis protein CcdA
LPSQCQKLRVGGGGSSGSCATRLAGHETVCQQNALVNIIDLLASILVKGLTNFIKQPLFSTSMEARRILLFFVMLSLVIGLAGAAFAAEVCKIDEKTCANSTTGSTANNSIGQQSSANSSVMPADAICIAYFYGEGCSNCAKTEPYIEEIEAKYGGKIHIEKYEVYHDLKSLQLYNKLCSVQNIPLEQRGVPLVAINDKYLMGVDNIKSGLDPEIEYMLNNNIKVCPLDGEMACHTFAGHNTSQSNQTDSLIPGLKTGITVPLIIGTGLVDGINPCAFAVLIFLLTFLLTVSNDKKRMIKAGIAYVIAVYITYLIAGLGLLTAIHVSGLSGIIVKVAAIASIIVGLINIKDFFWYGKGFTLKIPEKSKSTIEKWVHKGNVPAALVLGFLVAMFELPCTGGVYLAIIALMANTMTQAAAFGYLLLYNLMFVLPLIFIILLVTRGMKAEHIERWRQSKKNWMKLAIGLLLVALGLAMLIGIV